ncbi:DUF4269 domain-containing protein [Roseivivax sediminis]|uniref:DUF4269 domain-containing protein n=1 Tax=Roseivivax sediminis TaxID=936889 RepID=A0A1I1WIV1_9RHOB|nr:DUF4269 domain-containing protein [Roseivivax sediminis]SFD93373.1 protein of unknown function [Roseivivax sediminis]
MRPPYDDVIEELHILTRLAEFTPVVIGTPPLGLATEQSDIDIACTAPNFDRFSAVVRRAFGRMEAFSIRHVSHLSEPATVASFKAMGWEIELFCQRLATEYQWGVRHFRVEARLLALGPHLQESVRRLKRDGLKTEPAFARALSLQGDPYVAMLELELLDDARLRDIIDAATSLPRSAP